LGKTAQVIEAYKGRKSDIGGGCNGKHLRATCEPRISLRASARNANEGQKWAASPTSSPHINHTHCGRRRLIYTKCNQRSYANSSPFRHSSAVPNWKRASLGCRRSANSKWNMWETAPRIVVNANEIRISPTQFISIRQCAISLRQNYNIAAVKSNERPEQGAYMNTMPMERCI